VSRAVSDLVAARVRVPSAAEVADRTTVLATWATRGAGSALAAEAALRDVMAWLWGAPLAPIDAWSHQFEARPDDEPWKVHLIAVLLAARGRLRLARHDVITASELAALVGCDPATIARAIVSGKPMQGALLVRHGEGTGKRWPAPVAGEGARALLAAAEVPGFEAAPEGKPAKPRKRRA
jgi:hypothetical protein